MKYFLPFVLVAAVATHASAAVVTVTSGATQDGFAYAADPTTANSNSAISSNSTLKAAVSGGTDLLQGNLVRIGYFSGLSDATIKANATNLSFLNSNFVDFGDYHIGDTYPLNGLYQNSSTADTSSSGLNIAHQQIYMFVIAGTDNSSVANTIASAFQIGVFYLPKSANTAWQFPATSDFPAATTIDITDLTAGNNGTSLSSNADVVVGGFGPFTNATGGGGVDFTLASLTAIPEPNSLFLLVGSIGFAALRRRRAI